MKYSILSTLGQLGLSDFLTRFIHGGFILFVLARFASAATISYDSTGNTLSQQSVALAAPTITGQPVPLLAAAPGLIAGFSVTIASPSPVTYQWYFNGVLIPGATGDSLLLTTVTAATEGSYTVTVTNSTGSVTSQPSTLAFDSNDNGLGDAWELQYFGSLTQKANDDFDNDGATNAEEFLDGTQPADNSSHFFRLTVINVGGDVLTSPRKQRYAPGETVILRATPISPNHFFGWAGDDFRTDDSITVTMDRHKAIHADFSPSEVRVWGSSASGLTNVPVGLDHVKAVSAGSGHCLALKTDGTVVGWGSNSGGQSTIPAGLGYVLAISASGNYSLALRSDGTVAQWGVYPGGYGAGDVPFDLADVVAFAGGWRHAVALKNDGTVVEWGRNVVWSTPSGLSSVVAVEAGDNFSVALKSDGTVVVWGNNDTGVLSVPSGLSNVVAIATARGHVMALKADGTVVAWGENYSGQTAVPAALDGVEQISAGASHSLALESTGTVVTWGSSNYYQPAIPIGMAKVAAIAAGGDNSLAVMAIGRADALPEILEPALMIAAADTSFRYQIRVKNNATIFSATGLPPGLSLDSNTGVIAGTTQATGTFLLAISATNAAGTRSDTLRLTVIPTAPVFKLPSAMDVYVGNEFTYHPKDINAPSSYSASGLPPGLNIDATTGLLSGTPTQGGNYTVMLSATNSHGTGTGSMTMRVKTVFAWGYNANGQTDIPDGVNDVVALAAGETHSVALRSDGTVVAWGDNTYGQTDVPPNLSNIVAIAAGRNHTLALKSDGTVTGWGYNEYLQTDVPNGLTDVAAIAAGHYYSLALKHDGNVVVWGDAGDGIPNIPSGVSNVVAIASGYYHILVLKANGAVISWGYDENGQATVPEDLSGVVAVGAGSHHSLAIKSDGTGVGWGNNINGQTSMPTTETSFLDVTGGFWHSLGIKADGKLEVWGYSGDGLYDQVFSSSQITNAVSVTAGARHSMILLAAPPRVTSVLRQVVEANSQWSYRIRGSNLPTSYASIGLPSGTSVDTVTGVISGTAPASGTFSIPISVQNNYGTETVALVLSVKPSLADAVDAPGLSWSSGGNAVWDAELTTTSDGVDSAHSGGISDDGVSWIETSVTGPGSLTFQWKVSSEEGWDYLRFKIDGVEQKRISGSVGGWMAESFIISAGSHTLRWSYTKDEVVSDGLDAGWLDQVGYTSASTFNSWRTSQFTTAELADSAISGPLSDADKDGRSNLLEYALGLNPKIAESTGQPQVSTSAGNLTLRYAKARSDITYTVQTSTDLTVSAMWTTTGVTQGTPDSNGYVTASVPLTAPRRFLRLQVTLLP